MCLARLRASLPLTIVHAQLSKVPISREGPILKIETFSPRKLSLGSRYSDSFTQGWSSSYNVLGYTSQLVSGGPRGKGSVTLMFDSNDETWSGTRFDEFSAWLQSHVEDSNFTTGYVHQSSIPYSAFGVISIADFS